MGVEVTWDNDGQTIFRYSLDERWTWEEFFAAKKQANALMEAISRKFGVIIAAPHMSLLPLNTLSNARNALRTAHPNAVMIVMVVTQPFVRTVISTLRDMARVTPIPIEIASTLDEAREILHKRLRESDAASLSNH